MHFYKKILTVFMTTICTLGGVNPANAAGCNANKYVTKCDFYFSESEHPNVPEALRNWPGVEITPTSIFAFIGWVSRYLCWDFNDSRKNYENLRKLFNSTNPNDTIECYIIPQGTDIWSILTMINTNTAPAGTKYPVQQSVFGPVAEKLKNACTHSSAICKACPNGKSAGATYDNSTNKWTTFSTIADCYSGTDEDHTIKDNKGEFYYVNPGKCYYSGDSF